MSNIENFDIRTHIVESIVETFDTIVSMEIEISDSELPDVAGVNRMVATVNFAGHIIGLINIQVTQSLARLMMANKLHLEPEEDEDDGEIKNMLAEISNIVGGSLKSALNDAGHPCVISTLSLTYGADFSIKSPRMERFERFFFSCQEELILVEVGLETQQITGDADDFSAMDSLNQLKHVDVEKVNALDYRARVSEAVMDVFDTMLSTRLEATDSIPPDSLESLRDVGSVSFAGDATGMVSIHVGGDFTRELAANMLGMEVEALEGDQQIKDMMVELGIIVGGNLKSAFTDAGLSCALSTPSFTAGRDFKIESLNVDKYERFAFRSGDNIVLVEMAVKISKLVQAAGQETDIRPAQPQPPSSLQSASLETVKSKVAPSVDVDLDLLLDIPLEIKVELGRARIQIQELLSLAPGSALKLVKLEGEPVDILANDTLIAKGEVVVQNEKYGIRVTEITSRIQRVRSFSI